MHTILIPQIKQAVAAHCGISVEDLDRRGRRRFHARPRQISYLLSRELTGMSFPKIACLHARMDHGTVLRGIRSIEKVVARQGPTAALVEQIRATLSATAEG